MESNRGLGLLSSRLRVGLTILEVVTGITLLGIAVELRSMGSTS